jgi:F-type H+-transporting ATPase subunit b
MRRAHIARDIDTAETLRRETEEAIAAYEQAIAEAKQKAQSIAQDGRAKLNEEIATERAKLDRELAAKSKEAEARIDEAKASALKEVNKVAADVAADIVQRLIGVAPSGPELAKAVEAARKE